MGALRIREIKQAIQDALDDEHYFPNSLNMYHKFPVGSGETPTGYTGRLRYNDVLQRMEKYSGTAWEAIASQVNILPAGTKMLFYQAAAPTGWTQDTSFGNDECLRVIGSGSIGSGGDWAPTVDTYSGVSSHTAGSTTVTLHHTYTTTDQGNATSAIDLVTGTNDHVLPHNHSINNSGTHAHPITGTWRPAYIDVIVATKD